MAYRIDPIPDMEYQRYGPFGLIPDLTCARYCLKSLLKYWHQKAMGERINRLELPRPAAFFAHWLGYDPMTDYQHAGALLFHDQGKPNSGRGWEARLVYAAGPIILYGGGVGHAFAGVAGGYGAVPHAILLVGIGGTNAAPTFEFLDPLRGNGIQTMPFQPMQARIDRGIVYAQADIATKLSAAGANYYTRAHFDMFPWARF